MHGKNKGKFKALAHSKSGKLGVYEINKGKIKPLYNIKKGRKKLKPRPWLYPAANLMFKQGQHIFEIEANIQIKKAMRKGVRGIKF